MLKTGQLVEVRSKEEILATLDQQGRLDGMPFMPQMFSYCGQRFYVYRNAHKTCDTVSGRYIGLSVEKAVHLGHRCDGLAYGGCQAGCLIFWKEAWLKRVSDTASARPTIAIDSSTLVPPRCTECSVLAHTAKQQAGESIYLCQATTLLEYTKPLKWWDARQYLKAYISGNNSLGEILRGLTYLFYCYGTRAHSPRFGAPQRWLYDRARWIWGGIPFPRRAGLLKSTEKAPRIDLGLCPGELVRVKPYKEILKTLTEDGSNRGMKFDAELVPYCGRIYRVKAQVAPARVECVPPQPRDECAWLDGNWGWSGKRWQWVPGSWVVPPVGCYHAPSYAQWVSGAAQNEQDSRDLLFYFESRWYAESGAKSTCSAPTPCKGPKFGLEC
jgi:hypothetical protein